MQGSSGTCLTTRRNDLIREDFGDTRAVFDRRSGETHLLTPLPALVLQALGNEPLDFASLLSKLSEADAVTLDDEARARILAALQFLEQAELVESTPSGQR
jgi:PqqD family protein of HPr-rel-A system